MGQAISVLTNPPDEEHSSLRTTELEKSSPLAGFPGPFPLATGPFQLPGLTLITRTLNHLATPALHSALLECPPPLCSSWLLPQCSLTCQAGTGTPLLCGLLLRGFLGPQHVGVDPSFPRALPHVDRWWERVAHLRSSHYVHHGEQDDGQEGSDSQRQSLRTPEERHEDDGVATVDFLRAGGEQQSFWRGRACIPDLSLPVLRENRPLMTVWREPVHPTDTDL